MAATFSKLLGREIKVRAFPQPIVRGAMKAIGLFSPMIRDGGAMMEYISSGMYVADTTLQAELFGPVPSVEETFRRYIKEFAI
jgi:hypothetical protein